MNKKYQTVIIKTKNIFLDKINKKQLLKIKIKHLLIFLLRHRKSYYSLYGWRISLLALALLESYEINHRKDLLNIVEKYCLNFVKKPDLKVIDCVIVGEVLFKLKEIKNTNLYDNTLHIIYDYIRLFPTDKEGSKLYRITDSNKIFADTIGMICPFLMMYSHQFNISEAEDLAITQIDNFINNGLDDNSGLFYHGYNKSENIAYGVIGWGRAEGWVLRGITTALEYMQNKNKKMEYILFLNQHYENIMKYKIEDRFFSWQLPCTKGHVDTSTMSMILKSMLVFSKTSSYSIDSRLIDGLLAMANEKGEVLSCSAECHGLSEYPQVFGTFDFGQSFYLLFFNELIISESWNINGK